MIDFVLNNDLADLNDMHCVYKAAKLVRKSICAFTNTTVDKSIHVSSTTEDVPSDLYSLIRWIMVGILNNLETQKRTRVVDRTVLTMCQNIMYGFKSDRQVTYKANRDSGLFRTLSVHENPQVLGLA